MTGPEPSAHLRLSAMRACFEGVIPAVVATAAADGTPNVTYLSRVRMVDDERVALSNQFFSKTSQNLMENPRASVLVIDPRNYDHYRLTLVYERTERRGAVFEKLRDDVDAVAALSGMHDVFKLRAADVYRVLHVELVRAGGEAVRRRGFRGAEERLDDATAMQRLAELTARLGRCADLDMLVRATIDGLHSLLGYEHALMLLLDEEGRELYTIASYGYEAEGVGSEIRLGEGLIGMTALRAAPLRVGSIQQMRKYARSVRRSFEEHAGIGPGREIPVPGLADAESQAAVPMVALGQLMGVLAVESTEHAAFDERDVSVLTAVAAVVASAIEIDNRRAPEPDDGTPSSADERAPAPSGATTQVRFFEVDGSTFLDGDYLIKGVAGRILWSLLSQHEREQRVEFTNKEVRLDPSLELPEFRDNLESRLILLKRRLEERGAPIRIDKTGRGRFRLVVDRALQLDEVAAR